MQEDPSFSNTRIEAAFRTSAMATIRLSPNCSKPNPTNARPASVANPLPQNFRAKTKRQHRFSRHRPARPEIRIQPRVADVASIRLEDRRPQRQLSRGVLE